MQSLKDEIAQLQARNAELEAIVEQQKAEITTQQQKVIVGVQIWLMVANCTSLA